MSEPHAFEPDTSALSPSQYWDQKILTWESSRYSSGSFRGRSLQSRLTIAAKILNALPPQQSIVDIGCGSGRLFELLERPRFAKLYGIDISPIAILAAKAKKLGANVEFACADVSLQRLPVADCYVGLGLLDWLEDQDISEMFSQINGRKFIFSFSERRALPLRLAHQMYRRMTAFGSHAKFVPRYHTAEQISTLAASAGHLGFFRPSSMAFGSFVSNLPLGGL